MQYLLIFMNSFYIRRITASILILALYFTPSIQIMTIILLQVGYLCLLLHLKPYASPSDQRQEELNEYASLITLYCLLFFTGNVITDGETRQFLGFILIGICLINMSINFVPIVMQVKLSCRKRYYKRIQAKAQATKRAQLQARTKQEIVYNHNLEYRSELAENNQKHLKNFGVRYERKELNDGQIARKMQKLYNEEREMDTDYKEAQREEAEEQKERDLDEQQHHNVEEEKSEELDVHEAVAEIDAKYNSRSHFFDHTTPWHINATQDILILEPQAPPAPPANESKLIDTTATHGLLLIDTTVDNEATKKKPVTKKRKYKKKKKSQPKPQDKIEEKDDEIFIAADLTPREYEYDSIGAFDPKTRIYRDIPSQAVMEEWNINPYAYKEEVAASGEWFNGQWYPAPPENGYMMRQHTAKFKAQEEKKPLPMWHPDYKGKSFIKCEVGAVDKVVFSSDDDDNIDRDDKLVLAAMDRNKKYQQDLVNFQDAIDSWAKE